VAGREGLQKVQEFGCAASPVFSLLEEVADGLDHGMGRGGWVEGQLHFLFATTERGGEGEELGEEIGLHELPLNFTLVQRHPCYRPCNPEVIEIIQKTFGRNL